METIIYTVLFLFPGALIQYFYKLIVPERVEKEDTDDIQRMVGYFINSVLIAAFAIMPFLIVWKAKVSDLLSLYHNLLFGWNPIIYLVISVSLAGLFVLLRIYVFDQIAFRKSKNNRIRNPERLVWGTVVRKFDCKDMYVVLCKDGQVLRCGNPESLLPEEWEKDKALDLGWSDWLTDWFAKTSSDDPMRGHLVHEYYMLDTGYSIRFYKSEQLITYMNSFISSAEETEAAEVEAAELSKTV